MIIRPSLLVSGNSLPLYVKTTIFTLKDANVGTVIKVENVKANMHFENGV